jgi:hypothetical protein
VARTAGSVAAHMNRWHSLTGSKACLGLDPDRDERCVARDLRSVVENDCTQTAGRNRGKGRSLRVRAEVDAMLPIAQGERRPHPRPEQPRKRRRACFEHRHLDPEPSRRRRDL